MKRLLFLILISLAARRELARRAELHRWATAKVDELICDAIPVCSPECTP